MISSARAVEENMTHEAPYRITKHDEAHGCDALLATDGHTWTLHADKAYAFATFEAALLALRHVLIVFPNAVISGSILEGTHTQ